MLRAIGVDRVGPLFPDEKDPELAALYKAESVPEAQVRGVLAYLNEVPDVDFAERSPEHRLIW